jgi:phosphoserine phosphatase RsbU/P
LRADCAFFSAGAAGDVLGLAREDPPNRVSSKRLATARSVRASSQAALDRRIEEWMQILIAEDDAVSRRLLEATLRRWDYEVIVTCDGQQALDALQAPDAPPLAILDWMMPLVDGPQICRRLRSLERTQPTYIILLTAKGTKEDVVTGLDEGADDFMTKPFDRDELHSRIRVGIRMIELQRKLSARVRELTDAVTQVRQLQGLLPICSYCKRIRDDQNYWQQVESYLSRHSEIRFSHGICPECYETHAKEMFSQVGSS